MVFVALASSYNNAPVARQSDYMQRTGSAIRIAAAWAVLCVPAAAAQSAGSAGCKTFVDCGGPDLARAVPELNGTQFETSQDRLNALLRAVGESLAKMATEFAGVSAAEDINEMRFESGMAGIGRREKFRYVAQHSAQGQLEEFRLDPASQTPAPPPGKSDFLVFGHFIDLLSYLLPQYQGESRFRYVGRQTANGADDFILAFAHNRAESQLRSHIDAGPNGLQAPLQGLVWIDAASGRIRRLRMDLLPSGEDLPLRSFTADVVLDSIRFGAAGGALWFPARIAVHAKYREVELHSVHRFSDYRTYPGGAAGDVAPDAGAEDAWEILGRGMTLAGENKTSESIPVLREALRLNPEMPAAHYFLAIALRAGGDYGGAEAELREAAKEAPDSGPVHNLLGIVLFKRGDVPGAAGAFRASVALQPKDAVAHFNFGQALEKQGDTKTALDQYRTAAELAPDNANFKARVEQLARTANAPPAEATFKVNVRQVLVPVVVRDKDGHHVIGLTQADFKILEDGVEQKITSFSVENVGAEALAAKPSSAPEAQPAAAVSVAPKPTPARRTYLICIDTLHAEFSNLVHVREALTKLFASEQAGDAQYMVVAVGRSMQVVENATSDPQVVLQAIEPKRFEKLYLGSSKTSMQAEMAGFRRTLAEIRAACDSGDPSCLRKSSLPSEAGAVAEQERQNNMMFLSQLRSLLQQLSRGTDRRTLVLISGGFGLVPGKEAYELLVAYFPEFRSYNLRTVDRMPEMTPILRLAANSNIPIYTIDSRGLYTQEFYSAANSASAPPSLMPAISSAMSESALDAGLTLSEIAAATGGTAFRNSNDLLQGLQRAFADGRSYYMLAYVPSNSQTDGKFRAIQVQVRDQKMVVGAKKGYWAQEPAP
jgi:VWFA-related protein